MISCNTADQADQADSVTPNAVTPLPVTRAWNTPYPPRALRKPDLTVKDRMRRYRARRRLVKLIEAARLAGCSTWELRTAIEKALA